MPGTVSARATGRGLAGTARESGRRGRRNLAGATEGGPDRRVWGTRRARPGMAGPGSGVLVPSVT